MPLLCSSTQLDRAIERLDPVILRYPSLISARQARATAHFRKWLNSAPVQTQQVRSSPFSYTAGSGRPLPGDTLALHRARRDCGAILDREILPHVLSCQAVLEAYAGLPLPAARRAERALQLAPDDPHVLNQVGVIRFLAGHVASAAACFEQAAIREGHRPSSNVSFNWAKCAVMLGHPSAVELIECYLRQDPATSWRREALALIHQSEAELRQVNLPPPVVPGLTLGTTARQVDSSLGQPSAEQAWRGLSIRSYEDRGLELSLGPGQRVIGIELWRRGAGECDGVRVGDSVELARERWGPCMEDGEGYRVFWTGEWGIGVEYDKAGVISALSLAGRD